MKKSSSLFLQSTEVDNSNGMELQSLKRQVSYLEKANIDVKKLVTDRHVQVTSYMANENQKLNTAMMYGI